MSHYPSTAELAAFRRAVPRLAPFPSAPVHRNGNDGAYSWQRTKGIGYLETAPNAMCIVIPDGAVHTGAIARRRAGVLRSRAYDFMVTDALVDPTAHDILLDALATFEPRPEDDARCNLCYPA